MNSHSLFNMASSVACTSTWVQFNTIKHASPISHPYAKLKHHRTMIHLSTFNSLPSSRLCHFFSAQSLQMRAPLYRKTPFSIKKGTPVAKSEENVCPSLQKLPKQPKLDIDTRVAIILPKLKIGIYFAVWWSLNVVFNIYNKKVLNVYPFPWLTSTLSLAAGSAIMLFLWAFKIVEAPQVDCEFWKRLAPVAVAHTIGHVAATVSMSKVSVSFTHIIKSAEPAISVLIQRLVFGERFPCATYLSLLPIIGGCALAAATELHFNLIGFAGAMISNVAFVFRNIFSKKGMSDKGKSHVGSMNYYACLSMMSLAFLTPLAFVVEGPKVWVAGWKATTLVHGNQLLWWVVAQSVFYHLYNQVSYMSLDEISPLTFSIGNTIKRVAVIASSAAVFPTKTSPAHVLGAAVAVLGTLWYAQIKQ